MAQYSIPTGNDELGSLIDRALSGERVIVKQGEKPEVELRVVGTDTQRRKAEIYDKVRQLRGSLSVADPPIPLDRFYEWLYEDEPR